MAAFLEVRRAGGTTFYRLERPDDIELMKYWQKIDCGCRAYATARQATMPRIKDMITGLTQVVGVLPAHSTIYKVIPQ